MPIQVFIVDEHPVMRCALRQKLEEQSDIEVVGEAATAEETVARVSEMRPDVVLMDIYLPGEDGIETIKNIIKTSPDTKVLIFTRYTAATYAPRAVQAGAKGFFEKDAAAKESIVSDLIEAIRSVYKGGYYFSAPVYVQMQGSLPRMENRLDSERILFSAPSEKTDLATPMNRILAEVVSGSCHDISNYLHACDIQMKHNKYVAAKHGVETTIEMVKDLHDFVSQFREFPDRKKAFLERSEIHDFTHHLCASAIGRRRISLDVDSSQMDRGARIPQVLLRHILVPIVENAVEAIKRRNKKGKDARICVVLSSEKPEQLLRVAVEDTGVGWETDVEEMAEAIRTGRKVPTRGRKRGLGLRNVQRVVSRLSGDVRLLENPTGGACVEAWLDIRSL